jgi:hypothetical protein
MPGSSSGWLMDKPLRGEAAPVVLNGRGMSIEGMQRCVAYARRRGFLSLEPRLGLLERVTDSR